MAKRKNYNKYTRNTTRTIAMNTTELIGIKTAGTIAGGLTGTGAAIGNTAIGTGFALAGTSGLVNTTFGKGGLLDAMGSMGKTTKRKRR